MEKDEAGRSMRILVAIQGYYGERMAENIKRHAPANWNVNHITFPAGLPAIIDDTDEFLPGELPVADLLISSRGSSDDTRYGQKEWSQGSDCPCRQQGVAARRPGQANPEEVGIYGSGHGISCALLYPDGR